MNNTAHKENIEHKSAETAFFEDAGYGDWRISSAALAFTILFHLFLLLVLPSDFSSFISNGKEENFEELQIEIIPPEPDTEKFPEYIEANPYGNNLKPMDDAKESFKDQRAADEIPDPESKSPLPYVEGETKDSQKIVSGTDAKDTSISEEIEAIENIRNRPLVQPADASEQNTTTQPTPQTQPKEQQTQVQPQEQNKASAKEHEDTARQEKGQSANESKEPAKIEEQKQEPASVQTFPDGEIPVSTPEVPVNADQPAQRSDTTKVETQDTPKPTPTQSEDTSSTPQPVAENQLPAPRPRPVLDMKIPSGMIMDNRFRASAQGTISADSKFSEFGAYFQRMIEAISRQWNLLGNQYDLTSTYGTIVVIEYYIDSTGELTKIKTVFSNATSLATKLCEQSILSTAPYGVWSQEMVARFGDSEQSVTINFHYR